MKVITTVWLTNPEDAGTPIAHYHAYTGSMESQGWFSLGQFEIEFDPPTREEAIPKVVEGLRGQIKAVQAEAYQREKAILNQIDKLLSIGWDGGSVRVVEEDENGTPF